MTRLNTRYQCHNCRIVAAAVAAAVDNRRNNSGNSGMQAAGLPVRSPAVVVYNQFVGSLWPLGNLGCSCSTGCRLRWRHTAAAVESTMSAQCSAPVAGCNSAGSEVSAADWTAGADGMMTAADGSLRLHIHPHHSLHLIKNETKTQVLPGPLLVTGKRGTYLSHFCCLVIINTLNTSRKVI